MKEADYATKHGLVKYREMPKTKFIVMSPGRLTNLPGLTFSQRLKKQSRIRESAGLPALSR
jgi:hypothetical protein